MLTYHQLMWNYWRIHSDLSQMTWYLDLSCFNDFQLDFVSDELKLDWLVIMWDLILTPVDLLSTICPSLNSRKTNQVVNLVEYWAAKIQIFFDRAGRDWNNDDMGLNYDLSRMSLGSMCMCLKCLEAWCGFDLDDARLTSSEKGLLGLSKNQVFIVQNVVESALHFWGKQWNFILIRYWPCTMSENTCATFKNDAYVWSRWDLR